MLASIALGVVLASAVALTTGMRPAQAAFPGTNGKIVFVERDPEENDPGIKLINPSGSRLTTLRKGWASGYDPAISPNGTWVAYSAIPRFGRLEKSEIFKINVKTRKVTQITHNKRYDGNPTWSPDGTRIAFESGTFQLRDIHTDIFAKRADDKGKALNLTKTPNEDEFAPAWSPDGKEIAFQIDGGGLSESPPSDIFVQNLNTGQRRNLTNDGAERNDSDPNWSPDGSRIVFESHGREEDRPGNLDEFDRIYTMNASDGSDRILLAETWFANAEYGPEYRGTTYSPDGKKIAYVEAQNDIDRYINGRLYTMNASDGSNKQRIYTALEGGNAEGVLLLSPDWGVKVRR
jgi:TolB protein